MLGLGSFIWVCRVLREDCSPRIKMELIYLRTLGWCYTFLFVLRCLILGAILLPQYRVLCLFALMWYTSVGAIFSDKYFIKHNDRWEKEGRMTLYDIKKKYCHESSKSRKI